VRHLWGGPDLLRRRRLRLQLWLTRLWRRWVWGQLRVLRLEPVMQPGGRLHLRAQLQRKAVRVRWVRGQLRELLSGDLLQRLQSVRLYPELRREAVWARWVRRQLWGLQQPEPAVLQDGRQLDDLRRHLHAKLLGEGLRR
jgi:hypothetical protein